MKKFLSVILAIAVILSLSVFVGCSSEEPPTETSVQPSAAAPETPPAAPADDSDEISPETLRASKPSEYVREKVQEGMEVIVAIQLPTLTSSFMQMIADGFSAAMEAEGFVCQASASNLDMSTEITQIENYITMGCAAIMVMSPYTDALDAVAKQAKKAGTLFITYNVAPEYEIAGAIVVDSGRLGELTTEMASCWAQQRYADAGDNEVSVAIMLATDAPDSIVLYDKVLEAIEEDKLLNLVFIQPVTVSLTVDAGYSFAEAALTFDPGIRVFICGSSSVAVGANNYVTTMAGNPDLSGYGAFANSGDSASMELIDTAGEGGVSIYRGDINSGSGAPFTSMVSTVLGLLYGEIEYGNKIYEPFYSYDSVSFDYDERG